MPHLEGINQSTVGTPGSQQLAGEVPAEGSWTPWLPGSCWEKLRTRSCCCLAGRSTHGDSTVRSGWAWSIRIQVLRQELVPSVTEARGGHRGEAVLGGFRVQLPAHPAGRGVWGGVPDEV